MESMTWMRQISFFLYCSLYAVGRVADNGVGCHRRQIYGQNMLNNIHSDESLIMSRGVAKIVFESTFEEMQRI